MDANKLARQRVLIDLFRQLPTDYLLCACRLSCREWKAAVESETAQQEIWLPRANFMESNAMYVAKQCTFQQVVFESHKEAEQKHNTNFNALDRVLHYYSRILLWLAQRNICCSWSAQFYMNSDQMHLYWHQKHDRAEKMGATFNEIDTALALKTIGESRQAALDVALTRFVGIPFTPPV